MKKYTLASLLLLSVAIFVTSCNKENFLKKVVGTWKLDRYFKSNVEKTTFYDTTFVDYQIELMSDNVFNETWNTVTWSELVRYDSLGIIINPLDSTDITTIWDTVNYFDSTVVKKQITGRWDLINSEMDLQLRDTAFYSRQYRIKEIDKDLMKLEKGNEEFHFGH